MKAKLAAAILLSLLSGVVSADDFPPGYDLIRDEGTDENRRGAINFLGAGVSVADDSTNNETEVTIAGGGSGDTFSTIDVPAGTDPVASGTSTLTVTEDTFLTITGTAGTDTIAFTQVTTDIGTDGLIAANAVALGTDTTNAYVADLTAGTYIDVSGGGAETANITVTVDATEIETVTFGAGGNASNVWTFNLSGTDHTMTAASGNMDFSHDITVGGGNINTGNIALTVGDATTDSVTVTTDGTGDGEVVLPAQSISASEITNSTITTTQISGSAGITAAQTALTAGRSLTFSTNDILADAELYTDTKCIWWENPVATDDFKSVWIADNYAVTVTRLWCESDQTVNTMLQVDDGTPADMDSVDLACISTPDTDTSLDGDATIAAGDRVDVDVASVSGTPTWVSVCFTFTRDD